MKIEKAGSPAKSPLLSDAVIERDYTRSIEGQINGDTQDHSGASESGDQFKEPISTTQGSNFNEGQGDFDGPRNFEFEKEIDGDDPSDIGEGEDGGFDLSSTSAKEFANIIGDLIKVKVPELSYNYCQVDIANIAMHINKGNIHPQMRGVFEQVNETILEKLQFHDDEIKMWKKAFKAYLEYKQVRVANPETAFYIATATLAFTHLIKVRQIRNDVTKLVNDAIKSYNPEFFNSYYAKNPEAEQPQTESKKEEESKTDKKSL